MRTLLSTLLLLATFAAQTVLPADLSGVTVSPPGSGNLKAASLTASNLTAVVIVGTDSQKKLVSSTLTVAEANALHGVPLASAASVTSLALTVGGKQPAFTTGAGITNLANVLLMNLSAGANVTFTTNANGQVVIASSGGGGGGGPISDGNYGDVLVTGTGTVITINPDVVGNSKLANMVQGTIKGRPSTAGTGDPSDISALPWGFTGDVSSAAEGNTLTIGAGKVTLAMQANIGTGSVIGRNTAGTGAPEVLTTLPNGVQDNITRLGAVTTGTLSFSLLPTRTLTAGAGLSGGGTLAADRTFTLDMSTFTGNLTFWDSSQASRTITYGLSGSTDPVWTIGDNSVDLSTGVLKQGGNTVATLNGTETLANKTMTAPVLGLATATSINGSVIPTSKTLVVTTDTLAVHAATTSSALAGVISDETGTGALVFANTPTLVTPNIGAATGASLVLSGDLTAQNIYSGGTVHTNGSITIWGSTADLGFTITNSANGNYRFSLPASGLSGAYNLSFSGTNIVLAAAGGGLASTDIDTSAEIKAIVTDETGSGSLVFATSPTLVTPVLGVATATSVNKMAITAPATSSTLAIADGKTFTVSNTTTLVAPDSSTQTFQASDTIVGRATTDTLSNKTLTSPTINNGAANYNYPLATDDTSSGIYVTGLNNTGGVTQWDVVYLNASSQWVLADADGSGTYPAWGLATATISTGNATTVIVQGIVRNDGWAWTPGASLFLSTTAGGLTATAPSTTGNKVQVIAKALSATTILLRPSQDYGTAP